MKQPIRFTLGLLLACMSASCAPPTSVPPTAAMPQATPTTGQGASESASAEVTQEPAPFPLLEPGKFYAGKRRYAFEDASRDSRPVGITVWYPAVQPEGSSGTKLQVGTDRDPDRSGAPFPLILSSTKVASIFAPYLISHGFVWASVDGIDTYAQMNTEVIDQPLDILFALDQVASNPPEELAGMIDTDRAGAIGYSFDGNNALVLGGARIDPEHYLAQCPNPEPTTEAILSSTSAFGCGPAREWDDFVAYAGRTITASEDGLWQPITDARIRAVMPLAAEGWWLFGGRGLAAADRSVLMIVATQDGQYRENALIYKHLGTSKKTFISFVGPGHMMIYDPDMVARMAHFAVAYFGYHLQGREEMAWYFSEDFIAQHDDLTWGIYEGE